jgi:hypothetical protein
MAKHEPRYPIPINAIPIALERAHRFTSARMVRSPYGGGEGDLEALSAKAAKLMKLCDAVGFNCIDDGPFALFTDSVCPAICVTEECDYTTEMEPIKRKATASQAGVTPSRIAR